MFYVNAPDYWISHRTRAQVWGQSPPAVSRCDRVVCSRPMSWILFARGERINSLARSNSLTNSLRRHSTCVGAKSDNMICKWKLSLFFNESSLFYLLWPVMIKLFVIISSATVWHIRLSYIYYAVFDLVSVVAQDLNKCLERRGFFYL